MSSVVASASENITSNNPKLQRTIARFQTKVANKDYYEAHQTLRSLINRAAKLNQIDHAVDLIYHGSLILIENAQFASAADLINYLVEILNGNGVKSNKELLGKILTLLTKFPVSELGFGKIASEIVGWSSRHGEYKVGDPQIHDLLGLKYLHNDGLAKEEKEKEKEKEEVEAALTKNYATARDHLILGTNSSLKPLVDLTWNWFNDVSGDGDDDDDDGSGVRQLVQFVWFPVVNYLILKNVKLAKAFLGSIFALLDQKYGAVLQSKEIAADGDAFFKIRLFENALLRPLNFLQLAILTIQTSNKELFLKLRNTYATDINQQNLGLGVDKLGLVYFGIQVQKQVNFLQEMMGGLLGGKK